MWKRAALLWAVVKADARLVWRALQHPQCPTWLKVGCAALLLYLLSPIDLIPDWIPVLGVLDDVAVVTLALRWLYRLLPAQVRADVEGRASAQARPAAARVPLRLRDR